VADDNQQQLQEEKQAIKQQGRKLQKLQSANKKDRSTLMRQLQQITTLATQNGARVKILTTKKASLHTQFVATQKQLRLEKETIVSLQKHLAQTQQTNNQEKSVLRAQLQQLREQLQLARQTAASVTKELQSTRQALHTANADKSTQHQTLQAQNKENSALRQHAQRLQREAAVVEQALYASHNLSQGSYNCHYPPPPLNATFLNSKNAAVQALCRQHAVITKASSRRHRSLYM